MPMLADAHISSLGYLWLRDRKHLEKRHLGLFAANLKAAIHGRGKPPHANSSQLYRSSLSSSHSFHTNPSEGYLPSSNGVRNIHSQVHQTSRETQQQPLPPRLPYTNSLAHVSYSNAVKNGHKMTYNIPQAPQQQQSFPLQHYNVQSFSPSHLAAVGPIPSVPLQNDCAVEKAPAVEIPKELVS